MENLLKNLSSEQYECLRAHFVAQGSTSTTHGLGIPNTFIPMRHFTAPYPEPLKYIATKEELLDWKIDLEEYLKALGPTRADLARQFMNLRQGSHSVAEYIIEFSIVSTFYSKIPASYFIEFFIAGLKSEIFEEMRDLTPSSMEEAKILATNIERKLAMNQPKVKRFTSYPPSQGKISNHRTPSFTSTQSKGQSKDSKVMPLH